MNKHPDLANLALWVFGTINQSIKTRQGVAVAREVAAAEKTPPGERQPAGLTAVSSVLHRLLSLGALRLEGVLDQGENVLDAKTTDLGRSEETDPDNQKGKGFVFPGPFALCRSVSDYQLVEVAGIKFNDPTY
ncbi:hypothetical protein GFER_00010 [Geoalkalibacter ferrihydriticus DSM 17813]|uniref:Uncharacterized protein n=1 Tax=Geoalkalibacter ferrihydriticus DSM 17813 TaxID=1121915 RepID=A0A0C2HJH6_9BACT|nr:hypothetical protein [Geoalkalibacter ferrihydriticus]KIH77201.1 hypothetical protein GFER_00010 [Geoalkalibacter ferrihydriticus DSM 17813]